MSKARPTRQLSLAIRSAFSAGITASSGAGQSAALRTKIMTRDNYTCAYCNFRSERFQEIRPLNPNGMARSSKPEDWVTACHMCDQCLSLERTGMMGEGILIWLPELSQADLNHLVRALYIARSDDAPAADAARKSLDILKNRREEAKRRIGTDDVMILATAFSDQLSETEYMERNDKLDGLRLFSLDRRMQRTANGEVDRFPDMLAYWRSKNGPFGTMPPQNWSELASKLAG